MTHLNDFCAHYKLNSQYIVLWEYNNNSHVWCYKYLKFVLYHIMSERCALPQNQANKVCRHYREGFICLKHLSLSVSVSLFGS